MDLEKVCGLLCRRVTDFRGKERGGGGGGGEFFRLPITKGRATGNNN